MRQIGSIDKDEHAERFSDYLVTQGIENMVEQSDSGAVWLVWVENDDLLDRAKAELETFRANPADPRYESAERAEKIRKQAEKGEQRRRKHFVDVRTRWRQPSQLARPVTVVLAAISILVSVGGTKLGMVNEPVRPVVNALFIAPVDPETRLEIGQNLEAVRHGQVWRVITPIFLHFHPLHLVFNILFLLDLASMVETRRGTLFLVFFVLVSAVASNVAEYYLPNPFNTHPLFGGMSGVNYALFGYAWIKGRIQPQLGIGVSPQTVTIMLVWLVVCMLPNILGEGSRVANVAHVVGLLSGVACAYVPYALRRFRGRR